MNDTRPRCVACRDLVRRPHPSGLCPACRGTDWGRAQLEESEAPA